MSAAALMSVLCILFSLILMVESCNKGVYDVHTAHGFPQNSGKRGGDDGTKKPRPVPPHPFKKRSVDFEDETEQQQEELAASDLNNLVSLKIRELFDDIDNNRDGVITVPEWTRRKAGVEEFNRILRHVKSIDNTLSFDEFHSASLNL